MRTVTSALMSLFFALAGTAAANAHAAMTTSTPKDGATVQAGLTELSMDFSRPVRLTVVGVVHDSDKKAVSLSGALPSEFSKSVKVTTEPLNAGAYTVTWTGVAADGHVINGHFAFSVGAGPATQPKQ